MYRLIKTLQVLLTALFTFTVFAAYGIWTYAAETENIKTDAAIVLGTKVVGNQPSPMLRERINHSVWLYENGFVDKIIFTGGKTDGADMAESEVSRNYALKLDVPAEDILIETESMITEENFLYANEIAEEHGLDSFLVVSDPLHMKRALLMAQVAGIDAYSSPTQSSIFQTFSSQLPFFIRETVCYVAYVLALAFLH
ncbi:YdcF family protein [Planococcus shenhongbingii]|uniref:YdcF family protein n=1 Tax=Planococcus shenhongbingii TaxID=3058398 RepID=A0ABT8NEV4_9BACL|nr:MULTISPECIES: YdcF family protein [unclassified Planococcus (in: firmicutes)]MDN7246431.1 YdcF family protein [Planococcus sp. N017]WKA59423.1 YdcF family protein [Planococcus sp. N016]